jgi:Mlc titration factor MtfA (ptsG expression regulator)
MQDPDGLEFELDAELAGEAWDGGPVVLSWDDSAPPGNGPPAAPTAGNVVIHEFAHTLDLLDGDADGIPPLDPRLHAGLARATWAAELDEAYGRFCEALELLEDEIPRHIDPDSPAADPWYGRLPLDPYAATDPGEFFAVSSEALFMDAAALEAAFGRWCALLRRFYRLEP